LKDDDPWVTLAEQEPADTLDMTNLASIASSELSANKHDIQPLVYQACCLPDLMSTRLQHKSISNEATEVIAQCMKERPELARQGGHSLKDDDPWVTLAEQEPANTLEMTNLASIASSELSADNHEIQSLVYLEERPVDPNQSALKQDCKAETFRSAADHTETDILATMLTEKDTASPTSSPSISAITPVAEQGIVGKQGGDFISDC